MAAKNTTAVENPFAAWQAAGEQTMKQFTKAFADYEGLAALGKANLDAVAGANQAAARGAETVTKTILANAQQAWEDNVAHAQALAGVKSVNQFVELQSNHMQVSMKKAMDQGVALSELTTNVTNQVTGPLQAQAKAATEKFFKSVAA